MDGLIRNFRNFINEDNYVLEKYRNIDDKDKWSCICSCMDWIDVCIKYIKDNKEKIEKKINFDMEIFTYISSINLISESIQQLYRVFYNNKEYPLKKDSSVFKNKQISDDDMFKHIRAVFGAHSTNLKSFNGRERNFASYPNNIHTNGHFSVILYSNEVGKWGDIFEFSFKELEEYFEKRYFCLENIIKKIKQDKKEYLNKLCSEKIKEEKCLKKQLIILKEESKKRLNMDYNNYLIENMIDIVNFEITNFNNIPIILEYLEILKKFVNEFYMDLQNMNIDEKEDIFLSIHSYSYSKILENKYIDFDLNEMKKLLKEFVILDSNMCYSEIRSLCQIGMYFLAKKEKSKIITKDKKEVFDILYDVLII